MPVQPRRALHVVAAAQPLSVLVDGPWYLATYPDVEAAGIDPITHYLEQGWKERRRPNLYFDAAWFCAEHPQIGDDTDPLATYVQLGEQNGWPPAPHFDLAWYRKTFDPPRGQTALGHFLRHRWSGKVSPNADFDPDFYLQDNPDVANAGLDPFGHYFEQGLAEGRLPRPAIDIVSESGLFDQNYYLVNSVDIQEAGLDPIEHFCNAGWREGRKPSAYFDPAWYMKRYENAGPANPLLHYILVGEADGCRPSPYFDPVWYRQQYASENMQSPLQHYMQFRRTQKFSPLPFFDIEFYLKTYAETIRPNRDPFMHYLAVGGSRNFNPASWFDAAAYRQTHMKGRTNEVCPSDLAYDNPLMDFLTRFVLRK
jgi:hypothetical protein